jgi:AraC family transcriptional regulator of adaptative response / DNA-3-methyladenine glycosylase II
MKLAHDYMMERFYASDRSANGQFITGVLTTGIYCLPSCTARKPKPENVRFFAGEDEARGAGLRPCRRCRPNDFYRDYDPDLHLLETLAADVRKRPADFADAGDMVAASGIGATKLHELFRRHHHTTPAAFLARERVAAARRLLRDPAPTSTEVAFAAGFESISAFHENFRRLTGLTPGEYRRLGERPGFTLALPENYLASYTLGMLGRDALSLTERVSGSEAVKAVLLPSGPTRLHLAFRGGAVDVAVRSASPVSPADVREAHRMVVRMLGLAADPAPFERRVEKDGLARLVAGREGLRITQSPTVFEGLVWSIVGQQVNLAFAYALRRALVETCGLPAGEGMFAHPSPEAVSAVDYDTLTARQYSRRKAEYVVDTARAVATGELPVEGFPEEPATLVERRLLAVRGIGPWSANYVMMRACGFADCVPVGDTGLTMALMRFFGMDHRPGPAETIALMEPFAPFRSLATHHLWMTLGEPA